MNAQDLFPRAPRLVQTYLMDRDAGLMCRILGLYAARGLDLLKVDYAYAAQDVMKLEVAVCGQQAATADGVRVLVDKASTFVGVIAAAEQPETQRLSA